MEPEWLPSLQVHDTINHFASCAACLTIVFPEAVVQQQKFDASDALCLLQSSSV